VSAAAIVRACELVMQGQVVKQRGSLTLHVVRVFAIRHVDIE
jgi:hypothetical protein